MANTNTMKGREIIRAIMKHRGIGNAQAARMLNISPQAMWERTSNKTVKDIPVSLLAETVIPMGYKVAVIPQGIMLPPTAYEISPK